MATSRILPSTAQQPQEFSKPALLVVLAVLTLASLLPCTAAVVIVPAPYSTLVPRETSTGLIAQISFYNNQVIQTAVPLPSVTQQQLQQQQQQKKRRQESSASSASPTISGVSTTQIKDETTELSSATTTTTTVTSPLPSPFDGNLAATFKKSSCPQFINSFLTNSTFKACYPFSLLLQGSLGFFEAEKSAVTMTEILEVSCAADVNVCADYLDSVAERLVESGNCKHDLELGNQVVTEAYHGLVAYSELYAASCLQDKADGGYCFTKAVTNYTDTSNTYIYYLPLNVTIPQRAVPSCTWCVQTTMSIFQSAAADRRLPIAETYQAAAEIINTNCGLGFINNTLPEATLQGAAASGLAAASSSFLAIMVTLTVALMQDTVT